MARGPGRGWPPSTTEARRADDRQDIDRRVSPQEVPGHGRSRPGVPGRHGPPGLAWPIRALVVRDRLRRRPDGRVPGSGTTFRLLRRTVVRAGLSAVDVAIPAAL